MSATIRASEWLAHLTMFHRGDAETSAFPGIRWTGGHERSAHSDGWSFFQSSTRGLTIEALDDDARTMDGDDTDAFRRILRGARGGVPHCRAALVFLAVHNPAEYARLVDMKPPRLTLQITARAERATLPLDELLYSLFDPLTDDRPLPFGPVHGEPPAEPPRPREP